MNQTFGKTDYSKLFFIRMGLIFPMCLIYISATETLLKEILMKKEGEFLQSVIQSIYVRGSPGNGVALNTYDRKVHAQKVFFRALLLSATCTGHCKENLCSACSLPKLCPVFFF